MRLLGASTVCAVWLLAAGEALATPNFPAAIQGDLELDSPPDCAICHSGRPGRSDVTTPFGRAMRARGLVAGDEASLRKALLAIEADRVDSDGDRVPDIDQLQQGRDPNGSDQGYYVAPKYGCAIDRDPPRGRGSLAALLGLGILLALRRR